MNTCPPPPPILANTSPRSVRRNLFRRLRAAYTLVELSVALPLVTVLSLGMASAVLITTRSVPTQTSPVLTSHNYAKVLESIERDLRTATEILLYKPNGIIVRVPNRDADPRPEQISYKWSTIGQNSVLIRQINGDPEEVLLSGLRSFAFGYRTANATKPMLTPQITRSEELLIAKHEDWNLGFPFNLFVQDYSVSPSPSGWVAECFELPSQIPNDYHRLRFTRVELYGVRNGRNGSTMIEIQQLKPNASTSGIGLGSDTLLPASDVPGVWRWFDVNLSANTICDDASRRFALILKGNDSATPLFRYQFFNHSTSSSFTWPFLRWTNDGGSSWQPGVESDDLNELVDWDLRFRIYGRYETQTLAMEDVPCTVMDSIEVSLTSGDGRTVMNTTVPTLNRPEVN